ncbi:glycine oxidase ThiO [Pararhizobium antarcticum]|uniref:Glycine oxidase n=1 Tax=Pararhizobium antarcticum TaxID=1798805 RepID=A0A657M0D0_9HYPH|nr:glycine oxidase ThiO [Pararhizobium antarcticum]OJG00073.1 glycine oxidase [Rhizobium sp. 58]OJG01524.1 glycine oxidase [Pararhizobium antarcticum]
MRVLIKGAGVAGLTIAHELAIAGVTVKVVDTAPGVGTGASGYAGGMLAPWCERESAPDAVLTLGSKAADWWNAALPGHVRRNGTLVVAPARDDAELRRFASRTSGFTWLDEAGIAALEPALAGRFRQALFFRNEAHLDPRAALASLHLKLLGMGVAFSFGIDPDEEQAGFDRVVDCTGRHRIGSLNDLRAVRGEMLVLKTSEITLSRPVRLLHPRIPLYIVPRDNGLFMVGATMIESEDKGPITARSLMELLNAAYTLHPCFGEAQLIETGTGIRPAFPDNLPQMIEQDRQIFVNGLYRHGFLLAPAMARQVAETIGAGAGRAHRSQRRPIHPTRVPAQEGVAP